MLIKDNLTLSATLHSNMYQSYNFKYLSDNFKHQSDKLMAQFYCKSSFFGQSYLWSVFCFNDRQWLALNVNFKPCQLILWEYQPGKIWLLWPDDISIPKVLKRVTMIKVCFLGGNQMIKSGFHLFSKWPHFARLPFQVALNIKHIHRKFENASCFSAGIWTEI